MKNNNVELLFKILNPPEKLTKPNSLKLLPFKLKKLKISLPKLPLNLKVSSITSNKKKIKLLSPSTTNNLPMISLKNTILKTKKSSIY